MIPCLNTPGFVMFWYGMSRVPPMLLKAMPELQAR
jgi:hypothetical protein